MDTVIRNMTLEDRDVLLEMMRSFYASDAVFTNGSEEIFSNDIHACLSENPYLEGFIFEGGGSVQGYAMVAKSYSAEFGKPCIWLEDLYIKAPFRGLGIGRAFLAFLDKKYPHTLQRLEVEPENQSAVKLYEQCGFSVLPYMEMKK